jgi:SPP1 family holin
MNRGTKLRTFFFAVACINQSIVSVGDIDFGNQTANLIYKVISTAFTIITGAIALYYNNDFTEEACIGTGITRQLKAEKSKDYIGDIFFEDIDEEEESDE